MAQRSKVLIVDFEAPAREEIGAILEDMGYAYVEAQDGAIALGVARNENIGLVITNIFVKSVSLTELLIGIQRIHRNAETIVYSKLLNTATLELVREMGVFRVLKKPFDYSELRSAISAGHASRRLFRLAVVERLMHSDEPRRPTVLLAHADTPIFENLLRSFLKGGFRVECAKDQYHLAEKLTYSCYDAVVACKPYLDGIVVRKSAFNFVRKPFACIVKEQSEKKEKESRNYEMCFSGVTWVDHPIKAETLAKSVREGIRRGESIVTGGPLRRLANRTRNYVYAIRTTMGSMGLVLGASVVVLCILCGYVAGAMSSRPPVKRTPQDLGMLQQLQTMQNLPQAEQLQLLQNMKPEDLKELERKYKP